VGWYRRIAAPLSLLITALGCAPVVSHGPAVRPGFSGGVSAALGHGPTYENGDDPGPFYLGSLSASAAYGWRLPSGQVPPVRIGIAAPTAGGAAADLYVQVPPTWLGAGAAGVGVLTGISDRRRMPYVQLGVQNDRGVGIHLVNGWYATGQQQLVGYSADERATVTWISAQVPVAAWATVHAHAGYARGHVTRQLDRAQTPYIDEERWVQLGGVTLELHRHGQ
jgi:hypothetical protein